MCEVALPNKEVMFVYNKEILEKLDDIVHQSIAVAIQEVMYDNNADALKKQLRKLLLESVSCHDTVGENFYHGLMLGLCAMMNNRYEISFNRESGEGRYYIQLIPQNIRMPGILIELKAAKKDCSENTLKELSCTALQQINDRKYDTEMIARGVQTIFRFGVAFCGKRINQLF